VPSSAVNVTYSEINDITSARVYSYMGKSYNSSQVEHLQLFPRAGFLKAPSPIQVCSQDIVAALDLRDFQANWFSASGVPTGILKRNGEVNAADANEIRTRWQEMQATRQLAVIGNGFEYQTISDSPADMLFTEISKQSVQQIARLFGIPARKLVTGVDGTSDTYSNLTDENQVFYRHTLMAYTDAIGDALSNCLPRGTRAQFSFATLFAADQASRFAMWNTALAGEAFMTVEEVRKEEGLNV